MGYEGRFMSPFLKLPQSFRKLSVTAQLTLLSYPMSVGGEKEGGKERVRTRAREASKKGEREREWRGYSVRHS